MHAMAGFMSERLDVAEVAVVVHQNVGHAVVASARIGAAPLAGVFKNIDPPILHQPLFERCLIFLAEGRNRGDHPIARLAVAHLQFHLFYERRVEIVDVKLVELHLLFPHRDVIVHQREIFSDRGDQILIDGAVDCVGKEGRFEAAIEFPGAGAEKVALNLSLDQFAEGIGMRLIRLMHIDESRFPERPVWTLQVSVIGAI